MFKSILKLTSLYIALFIIVLWWIWAYAAIDWSQTPSWESFWGGLMKNYFEKILVNTGSNSDWTVKMTEKIVDVDCWAGKALRGFDSTWAVLCEDL